ncbi:pilus assembly protein CpaE [Tessaracoccus caeni]|uniref:pilus assembly protein CpaE n=1 Tax=Tessaracoccus caeni TaxID=3031239 RepID=UPI0023DAF1F6|nr:pilus assembly protein CpaE [Tessaracoccus caeni]MDF1488401.1 pilus assembly protein CpaE [Tessaracoccus caeni]
MLSLSLARRIKPAVTWRPASGDRFMIPDKEMDDEIFHIAEMTIEVHTHHGAGVVKFNGTTEWALDSIPADQVLWLPREDQLRELLGDRFVALEHQDDEWVVTYRVDDANRRTRAADVEDAYALAVLGE